MRIRDESRTSTAVVDDTTGEQTEINEHGPAVSEAEIELFRDKLLYLAKGAGVCVFAGSLPRGVPDSLYAELVGELKGMGVTTVLDAEGEPMRLAMRSEPSMVSPNELEAEELVGHEFADDDDRLRGLQEIVELGPGEVTMTLPSGCIGLVGDEGERRLYRVTLEPRETRSTVGSGDAFLAGYVAARYTGSPARGVPPLRSRLRRRVDPALRRRRGRPPRGRAPDARGRGRGAAGRGGYLTVRDDPAKRGKPCRGAAAAHCYADLSRPPPNLGCRHGSRDRSRQEGPSRLRLR